MDQSDRIRFFKKQVVVIFFLYSSASLLINLCFWVELFPAVPKLLI
jgi:hypothetical protein